jgi:predicted DNA-binding protein (UPF0251 family)
MNNGGYAERARENRERVHALQEAERAVTVASGYERLDEGALGDMTANNVYLVPLEVGLRIKLGIPAGLDETELTSVAVAALVDACSKRKASTRLAIRWALKDLVKYQLRLNKQIVEMPFDVTTATPPEYFDWKLIDKLPRRQVEAFTLIHREELTEGDAAKRMGITQQAVSRLVSKAEKKLGLGVVKQAA